MIYMPTFAEVLEVSRIRGRISENPGAWGGVRAAWTMFQGGGKTLFDVSGYGNHGTLINMDPATDWVIGGNPRLPGYALDFDGTSNYVDTGFIANGTPQRSVCIWHNTAVGSVGTKYLVDSTDGAKGFALRTRTGSAVTMQAVLFTAGGTIVLDLASVRDGDWHFLCFTYDGVILRAYNDGVEIATNSDGSGDTIASTSSMTIAAEFDGTDQVTTQVSACSVYDRALAPAEIKQLSDEPAAMFTRRRRVFAAAVVPAQSIVPKVIAAYYGVNA